jgi:hypothetical protein
LTTIQRKPRRVLSRKGRSKFCSFSNGKRVNTTAICYVGAAGYCVPPMLIYKKAKGCDDFIDEAPQGNFPAFNPESILSTKGFS